MDDRIQTISLNCSVLAILLKQIQSYSSRFLVSRKDNGIDRSELQYQVTVFCRLD